ncbi:hypothetical protein LAZ67_3002184 [Cordylochernes scorpioides]|uniref:Uncharacterized protein n=1 Tax=Cordylochernes scorpioides TaxID=51811 RepID=A0ABY6K7P6_9ARAC|nr:hypothetical protein LAZ67_3002184 [Cordylochernes scorpioides]
MDSDNSSKDVVQRLPPQQDRIPSRRNCGGSGSRNSPPLPPQTTEPPHHLTTTTDGRHRVFFLCTVTGIKCCYTFLHTHLHQNATLKIRKDKLQDETAIYFRQEQTMNDKQKITQMFLLNTKQTFTVLTAMKKNIFFAVKTVEVCFVFKRNIRASFLLLLLMCPMKSLRCPHFIPIILI